MLDRYTSTNADLPRFAQHGSTLVPLSQSESPERHESRCLLKPICDGQARRRGGKEALLDCLERNEKAGIVYHREGIIGDYDEFDDIEKLIEFIQSGKRPTA